MDISMNNSVDTDGLNVSLCDDLNLSNSEDDVFMKSRSARKRKAQGIRHRLNSSSKKKKIISCKLSTSSTGSFSKENLRGKNKKLAVDLQKLKITLSKLNREYVALQKYNQEAMVTVRRKRAQVNDIQNHIKNETKMRIQNGMSKVQDIISKSLTKMVSHAKSSVTSPLDKSSVDNRDSLKMFDVLTTQVDRPANLNTLTQDSEPVPEVNKLERKIRRSALVYDPPRSHNQLKKTLEKPTNSLLIEPSDVCNKLQQSVTADSSDIHSNFITESFEAIPMFVITPADNDCTMYPNDEMDTTLVCATQSVNNFQKDTPMLKPRGIGLKTKFPVKRYNFETLENKTLHEQSSNLPKVNLNPNHTSNNTSKSTVENTQQVNKIFVSSRDREKTCNFRETFMPKQKVKSKSKIKKKVEEPPPVVTPKIPKTKSIFDFHIESPLVLPDNKFPADAKNIPQSSKLKCLNSNKSPDSKYIELKVGGRSRSRGTPKKDVTTTENAVEDSGSSQTYTMSVNLNSPKKKVSDPKTRGRSRSRGRPKKDATNTENTVEDSSLSQTYTMPVKLNSPEKKVSDPTTRGRSRSRGRPKKDATNTENTVEDSSLSQTYTMPVKLNSPEKKVSDPTTRGRSRSRGRPKKDATDTENAAEDSGLPISQTYTMPVKLNSPEKKVSDPKTRGRSHSRGRPKKDATDTENAAEDSGLPISQTYTMPVKLNSPEKKVSDPKTRGRSRSRGRPKKDATSTENTAEDSGLLISQTYTMPVKLNSPEKKVSDPKTRGRSRSRGRPKKDATDTENADDDSGLPISQTYTMPVKQNSPEKKVSDPKTRGRSRSRGRPKKDATSTENTAEDSGLLIRQTYTMPVKLNSPEKKDSDPKTRDRSCSRSRPKKEIEDTTQIYSAAVKLNSPDTKSTDAKRQIRSRSRGRSDKDISAENSVTDSHSNQSFAVPVKLTCPDNVSFDPKMSSRSHSGGISEINSSENPADETNPVYSASVNSSPRSRGGHKKQTTSPDKKSSDYNGQGKSQSRDKPMEEINTSENSTDRSNNVYSAPVKINSPDSKSTNLKFRGRSRSRGRPKKETIDIDLLENSDCSPLDKLNRLDIIATEYLDDDPESNKAYSALVNMNSPNTKPSVVKVKSRGRSQSRGRQKKKKITQGDLEKPAEDFDYSAPVNMISPNSKPSVLRSGRSRSRGRPKKEIAAIENAVKKPEFISDFSAPFSFSSPVKKSFDITCQVNDQNKSRSKIINNSENSVKTAVKSIENSVLCEVYSAPIKMNSPDYKSSELKNQGRSRSRARPKKDMSVESVVKNSETSEIYSAPVKLSSPDSKSSDLKGRGRSRSRGRPKKDTSVESVVENSEISEPYIAQVKLNSPDSKSLDLKFQSRGRSRSRGRSKKDMATTEGAITNSLLSENHSVPVKMNSPDSISKNKSRGRSISRCRPKTDTTADSTSVNIIQPNSPASTICTELSQQRGHSNNLRLSVKDLSNKDSHCQFQSDCTHDIESESSKKTKLSPSASKRRKRKSEDNGLPMQSKKAANENKNILLESQKENVNKNVELVSKKENSVSKVNPWALKAQKARSRSSKLLNLPTKLIPSLEQGDLIDHMTSRQSEISSKKLSDVHVNHDSLLDVKRISIDEITGERKIRRAACAVSYKEPSLSSKMRREDVLEKQKTRLNEQIFDDNT